MIDRRRIGPRSTRVTVSPLLALVALLVAVQFSPAAAAEGWPRFRGPDATGVAPDDPRLPERWDAKTNVRWRTAIPGWGWASPIVWGDRVFLSSVTSSTPYERPKKGLYRGQGRRGVPGGVHRWMVFCVDAGSGEIRWSRVAREGRPPTGRHPKNTYASETPTTDGERVYVLFGDVGLYCYDLDGTPLWTHPIQPRKTFLDYGAAASPVVHDGQVLFVYDNQEDSSITSLDARTGKVRWSTKRDEKSTWATPFVWKHGGGAEIITSGRTRIRSYDLSGKLLWQLGGTMSNLIIPSPFAADGLLYVTSGYIGDAVRPVYAIRPGARGDITPEEGKESESEFIAWYQPKAGPYNTSPIVYRGLYYTLYDRGFLTCHGAKTGERIYGKTRFPAGASFTASPWAYNGKIFCLGEDGDTYVVKAGRQFELLRTNSLDELSMASPAIADGKLFLRTASHLYCLSAGAGK